jgi:hypothetical protein
VNVSPQFKWSFQAEQGKACASDQAELASFIFDRLCTIYREEVFGLQDIVMKACLWTQYSMVRTVSQATCDPLKRAKN